MSKIETNTIDNISGSSTLTIGDSNASTISIPKNITLGASGTTITVPSGATITNNGTQTGFGGANTPAFSASSGNQSISSSTWTKIQFQTENFDTNSNYDNSTNYRFTPTIAGKYYVFASIGASASITYGNAIRVAIYKNGTQYRQNAVATWTNSTETYSTPFVGSIIDFNGSTDYVEAYGVYESGAGLFFVGGSHSEFGAYKIIE